MSKGWYVKVDTQVVFNVDTNIGVVASCEREAGLKAQEIVAEWLDRHEYKDVLEQALPLDIEMGGTIWTRGAATAAIDFDTMQAWSITPDPDFDPDPEQESASEPDALTLMETVQCLNEAFHDLDESHPLKEWRAQHGIAEVRDRLNALALYCELTYQKVKERYDFDECFDWNFVPRFIEQCITDDFMPRSEDILVLAVLWRQS